MKRVLILFLFFYILALIQVSFLIHFKTFGQIPNLILISAILFFLLESPKKNFGFFAAFFGGFFIDLWSSQLWGISIILLIILAFLLKRILLILKEINVFWFLLFFALSLIFYNLFLNFSFYLLNFETLEITSSLKNIRGVSEIIPQFWGSLKTNLAIEIIPNLILGLIGFYFLHFVKRCHLFSKLLSRFWV